MLDWLWCLLGSHDWTCDANENIAPPDLNGQGDIAAQFHRYARGWCKKCRFYMKPHKRPPKSDYIDIAEQLCPWRGSQEEAKSASY